MCGGGGGDGGAAEARAREEQRQARIRAGMRQIDKAFSGFDDAFFDSRAQGYRDYALPQLEEQWTNTLRDLTYALSRSGMLNSSVAAEKQAEAKRMYDRYKQQIESQAANYAAQARGDVERNRGDLVAQLNATADPTAAANAAMARAQSLTAMPAFSPLGQLFADFTEGLGRYQATNRATDLANQIRLYNPGGSSGGSGRIIN